MTPEDIKKLVLESGWPDSLVSQVIMNKLVEFARAVAAHEREKCAALCDDNHAYFMQQANEGDSTGASDFRAEGAEQCATAIRRWAA